MLMTAFVVPHLGDGPFWASRIWPEADKCKTYWWANILAVSNFIPVENQVNLYFDDLDIIINNKIIVNSNYLNTMCSVKRSPTGLIYLKYLYLKL